MPFTFKDGSVAGVCSVCGDKAWSIRSNKCEKHRSATPYKSKAKKNRRPPAAAAEAPSESMGAQLVGAAGEITAKTFSPRPPTAAEWEDKLTALVVLATMTYVEYVVVRPFHLPEPHATEAVSMLGMTEDEARTVVEPCSYLIGRSELNKKHGREAIEILAFAPAVLAIVSWADRVSSFRQQMQAQLGGPDVRLQSVATAPRTSETGGGAPIANFGLGEWDPDKAPTARVHGNGPHVDLADRPVT